MSTGGGRRLGFKLRGPSRAMLRDLSFSFAGSDADALIIENADQSGGRIFCDQVLCGGSDGSRRCDIALLVDGIEQSDVTYLNGGWGEFTRGGVVVKGGPVRKSGGKTNGQVSLLLGALGNNESRLIDVQDDIPNVMSLAVGATPDEQAVLETLSQIRGLRIEPPVRRREGVTDVKLFRVQARASQGRMGLVMKRLL